MEEYIPLLKTILLPLVGGLSCAWYCVAFFNRQARLRRTGIRTEGIIFDFYNEAFTTPGLEEKHLPYPIIRFVTREGEWITERYTLAAHSRMKQGDKVQVWYSASDPRQFYIYTWHIDTILAGLGTIGGIGAIGFGLYKLIEYLLN